VQERRVEVVFIAGGPAISAKSADLLPAP
jgi:hypothetical protein